MTQTRGHTDMIDTYYKLLVKSPKEGEKYSITFIDFELYMDTLSKCETMGLEVLEASAGYKITVSKYELHGSGINLDGLGI